MVANGSGVAVLSDMVYRPWSLEGRRIERSSSGSDSADERGTGLAQGRGDIAAMRAVREYFRHAYTAQWVRPGV